MNGSMRLAALATAGAVALAGGLLTNGQAEAADPVKIGMITTLSGGGSSLGIAAAPEKSILTAALLCFLANNSPASPVRRTLP